MKYITETKKISDTLYSVMMNNGIELGEFVKDVDGFFYFWVNKNLSGCLSESIIRYVADELKELNKEWDKEIDKLFKSVCPPE